MELERELEARSFDSQSYNGKFSLTLCDVLIDLDAGYLSMNEPRMHNHCIKTLAVAFDRIGDHVQAAHMYSQLFKSCVRLFGRCHKRSINALVTLGSAQISQPHMTQEGITSFENALALCEELHHGVDSPEYLSIGPHSLLHLSLRLCLLFCCVVNVIADAYLQSRYLALCLASIFV